MFNSMPVRDCFCCCFSKVCLLSSLSSADIAGGATLSEALANTGLAMYNYMTPLSGLTINASVDR